MSNLRYIELSSSYRDRNLWPSPAEFEVPISQTGVLSKNNAVDPVSLAEPLFAWSGNCLTIGGTAIILAIISNPFSGNLAYASDGLVFSITSTAPYQQLKNYYNGLILFESDRNNFRRIINSIYEGLDATGNYREKIFIASPLSDTFAYSDNVIIQDPSDFTNVNMPFLFVPNGATQENAYNNYILYNETINQYRPILRYDNTTNIITLDTTTSSISTDMSGPIAISGSAGTYWTITDNFSLRINPPIIPFLGTNTTLGTSPTVFNTFDADIGGGNFITIQTSLSTLIITDPSGTTLSSITDFYKNDFLRILPFGSTILSSDVRYEFDPTPSNNQSRRIVSYIRYEDFNNPGIFYGVFYLATPYNTTIDNLYITTPSFSGCSIEILAYNYDNYNPFIYSGSLTSQQENVCYEMQLISLTLPNAVLNVANGGRLVSYPYIYVEISNISNGTLKNIMYSNNPNATNAIFKCQIYDINLPQNTPFVRIDGTGMLATIKFKPNDNLYLKVFMDNGQLFQTILPELYSPSKPNSFNQITAMFSIKRIQ